MPVERFTVDALAATPWKNGGGVTREIACRPAGAGLHDFEWRASIARISCDGPFSPFPGIDRVITLLDGAGVRLRSADAAVDHRLDTPLAPFAFAGESPIRAELLQGPCHDLNVMTRRGRQRADVRVLRAGDALAAPAGVLLAVAGGWTATSPAGEELAVAPGAGLWWHGMSGRWRVAPAQDGGALVAVLVSPAAERSCP